MANKDEYYSKAIAQWQSRNFKEAINLFEKFLKLKPKDPQVLSYIGILELQIGNYEKGIDKLNHSLKLDPFDSNIKLNLSNALVDYANHLIKKNHLDIAKEKLEKSIKIFPENEVAFQNLIKLLIELRDFGKIEKYFKDLIKLNSTNPEYYYLLGNSFFDQCKFNKALFQYQAAENLDPKFVKSIFNQALCFEFLGNYTKSIEKYDQCLKIDPNYELALLNKGMLLLENSDYTLGWKLYKYRWRSKKNNGQYIFNPNNELVSKHEFNKRILVWAEQGVGDQILFSSMLADFNNLVKDLTVSIDKRLKTIYERSFPKIKFISNQEKIEIKNFDFHLPMGNLGFFLRNRSEDFKTQKNQFLFPDDQIKKNILKDVKNSKKIICGLSWTSSNKDYGRWKSISFQEIAKKISSLNFKFLNLEYENNFDEIKHLSEKHNLDFDNFQDIDKFNDFESLSALISSCDIVVTISNVTAHFAGALGIKTYLLAPYSFGRFWYWSDESLSRWYPSISIIRQKNQFSWDETLKDLVEILLKYNKS